MRLEDLPLRCGGWDKGTRGLGVVLGDNPLGCRGWDKGTWGLGVGLDGWRTKNGCFCSPGCCSKVCVVSIHKLMDISHILGLSTFCSISHVCKQIVLSMCTAQCGSMEAKALNFVLRAASSEHYKSSTRRVFTYVVGGRVGMNDTCYFTLDMKKLVPTPPHTISCGASCMRASSRNVPHTTPSVA